MTIFQWPFATSTISSDYGPRPGVGKGYHDGTDFAIARGTAIPAVADGTVTNVWIHPDAGPYAIDIDHGGGVHSQYWHCDSKVVTAGQRVTRGQKIGTVGSRGLSTGPHLHFEIHAPGSPSGRATWPARSFFASRGVATDYAFGLTKSAQKALQGALAELGYYNGKIDGKFGKDSVAATQTWLKKLGLLDKDYTVDGTPGTTYARALQTLAKRGGYIGKLDGAPGTGTSKALITYITEEVMALSDSDINKIASAIWDKRMSGGRKLPTGVTIPAETGGDRLREIRRSTNGLMGRTLRMESQIGALTATVKVLADAKGIDGDMVVKAVEAAVDRALADLQITLSTDSE